MEQLTGPSPGPGQPYLPGPPRMVELADLPRVVADAARLAQRGELVVFGSSALGSGSSTRRGAAMSISGATRPLAGELLGADSMALAREGPGEVVSKGVLAPAGRRCSHRPAGVLSVQPARFANSHSRRRCSLSATR